ncbi:hypothetical protein cypCar_00002327 [Cyprinus carpio]|nr:hypothetical protein cypCar_00002327 [Cyprinus carpio]
MTQNEKQKLSGDEEIIKELCVSNGLCYEKVCQEGSGEMVLEMFFSGFPRMVGLSLFPRLSSLTIVGQSISSIQGLEYCPLLKELWVVECKLNEISGLHNCVHLQKLFLYDNNIQQITNLEMLVNLHVLWLNNNEISEIQGLNSLVNLKELNLADNAVETLGHCLDSNINLHNLNLSGNKISSFKSQFCLFDCVQDYQELTHLARLPRLRHLSLKDPQSIPNPLCLLYNYYIHVLYHMPHLQRLDTYDISSKHLKDTAEMECELSCVQSVGKKSGEPEDLTSDFGNNHSHEQRLQHKLDALKDRLKFWERSLEEVEACHQQNVALASDRRDMMVRFLLLELETVGNIRFEEGNTSEPWYHMFTSCYDLLLSRFCAWDYKPHNISGIKISRIIRQLIISKVFLGRSAAVKEGLPIDCDHYPKANSVYHSTSSKEQKHIAQTAPDMLCPSSLPDSCECKQQQKLWYMFDNEMVLPEYLVDFEYITQDTSQPSPDSPSSSHASPADAPSVSRAELDLDEEALNMEPILKPHPKLLSLDEKSTLTVARANVLSQITVLNLHGNSLNKIPEISRLTALKQLTLSFNEFTHLDDISHMPNLEYLDVSFNHISSLEGLRGLGQLIELDLRWNQLTRIRDDMNVLRKHVPALLRLDTRHNPWHRNECVRMVVLGRLKSLTYLDDVFVMEEEAAAAVQVAARSRINQITALNLDGLRLTRLSNLERLVNLRWASFDNNELTRIEGLEHCTLLEELSLNNNSISRLEGLCAMHRLTRLSINSNHLQCLDGNVLDQLPNLHFLSVENNIISSLHGLQRSRSLFELYVGNNDISTTRDIYHLKETCESETAKDVFEGRLNADMVAEKLGHTNYRDLSELNLQSSSVRMVDLAPADLFSNLRSINLDHNNLTSFSGLVFLPNIKVLSLNYNHIESILPRQKVQSHMSNKQILHHKVSSSGYGQQNSRPSREGLNDNLEPLMSSLEVLHLGYNGNEISQVDGLDGLRRLRELVLDRNRIKSLSENSFCGQGVLLDLHLAENRIRELNHLQPLTELRRLFLDMNKILDILELEKLEVLPSLMELSVVGNP